MDEKEALSLLESLGIRKNLEKITEGQNLVKLISNDFGGLVEMVIQAKENQTI